MRVIERGGSGKRRGVKGGHREKIVINTFGIPLSMSQTRMGVIRGKHLPENG